MLNDLVIPVPSKENDEVFKKVECQFMPLYDISTCESTFLNYDLNDYSECYEIDQYYNSLRSHLKSQPFLIKSTRKCGYGLFYDIGKDASIPADTCLFPYSGCVQEFSAEKSSSIYEVSLKLEDKDTRHIFVVDAKKFGGFPRFINHSHEPNCELITAWKNGYHGLLPFVVSNEQIYGQSELTIQYEWYRSHMEWENGNVTPCYCGSSFCLKFIERRSCKEKHDIELLRLSSPFALVSDLVVRGQCVKRVMEESETSEWIKHYINPKPPKPIKFFLGLEMECKAWSWNEKVSSQKWENHLLKICWIILLC